MVRRSPSARYLWTPHHLVVFSLRVPSRMATSHVLCNRPLLRTPHRQYHFRAPDVHTPCVSPGRIDTPSRSRLRRTHSPRKASDPWEPLGAELRVPCRIPTCIATLVIKHCAAHRLRMLDSCHTTVSGSQRPTGSGLATRATRSCACCVEEGSYNTDPEVRIMMLGGQLKTCVDFV